MMDSENIYNDTFYENCFEFQLFFLYESDVLSGIESTFFDRKIHTSYTYVVVFVLVGTHSKILLENSKN